MRQPIFVGLKEEIEVPRVPQVPRVPRDEEILTIDKRQLKLVNLDKIFWPKEKYTKGDLIDYYRKIAPFILPHLIN